MSIIIKDGSVVYGPNGKVMIQCDAKFPMHPPYNRCAATSEGSDAFCMFVTRGGSIYHFCCLSHALLWLADQVDTEIENLHIKLAELEFANDNEDQ